MGSSSSKFRKHLQNGDEYAAVHLYNNNSELRKGLDPNLSYGEAHAHDTPMHYAARHAMKSLLRIFLSELGGNPNKKNSRNETAMHCVCMNSASNRSFHIEQRRLECLSLILLWRGATLKDGEVEKADMFCKDEKGNTGLHYAAASGLTGCVELLVSHNGPLFIENAQRQTPCDCAEKCGRSNIALYLESKMVFSNDGVTDADEEVEEIMTEINAQEAYSGLRAQDLQEAKDQLLVETSDMLRIPLFTAEALLRNHEWSREQLLESWMEDAVACCEKCGVVPPSSVYHERPMPTADSLHQDLSTQIAATVNTVEIICDICALLIGGNEGSVSVSCEHQFCKGCWERYLNGKIQEGEIHNITCPAYECSKLVPVELIETVVSRDMARKYLQFDIKAFVESNPNIKWCPYPGCGRAVRLPENEVTSPTSYPGSQSRKQTHDTSHAVDCGNGHYFCWECLGEAHEPCSCEHWKKWFERIAEIKPEELTNTEVETECAANYLWLVTNSKPCPNCRSPIQKNEGCNHMKCSKCKHDFCWVCQESWKKHSSATGGYFRCNRYEIVKKIEECTDANKSEAEARNRKMQELNRFMHYYSRFKNHDNSYKLEEPLLSTAKEKMMVLARAVTDPETANNETKFVEDAVRQLLKARRVLKCSYIYGYYLDDTGYKKTIFEFMQTELEECMESLSQMIARPYLRTPRGKIIRTSNLVQRKRHEFGAAIAKGLIPPDSSPNLRKKRRKEMDEDLRHALLASVRDVDPNNPWVIDKSGRHTNVAALFDWPLDADSDESDPEPESVDIPPPSVGLCSREGCSKSRVHNPRTGNTHEYCSHRCMRMDKTNHHEEEEVDPSAFFTDYQLDLLRAMEMSRLQFVQEMKGLQAGLGTSPEHSTTTPPSTSPSRVPLPAEPKPSTSTVEEKKEPAPPQENPAVFTRVEGDPEFRRAMELSRKVATDEERDLKKAIEMSLKEQQQPQASGSSGSSGNEKPDLTIAELDHSPSRGAGSVPSYTSTFQDDLEEITLHEALKSPQAGSFIQMEPLLDTSFTPTNASSQFGPIKDLSVANLVSKDEDKTREFNSKNFTQLFREGESVASTYLPANEQDFTLIRRPEDREPDFTPLRRNDSARSRASHDGVVGHHMTRSVAEVTRTVSDHGVRGRSERRDRERSGSDRLRHHQHHHRHERSIHLSLGKSAGKREVKARRYSSTQLDQDDDFIPPRRERRKCYSYGGQKETLPLDQSEVWIPRADFGDRLNQSGGRERVNPTRPSDLRGTDLSSTSRASEENEDLESLLKRLIVPFHPSSEESDAGTSRPEPEEGTEDSISEGAVYV